MKPIINPFMIYLAGITDSLNNVIIFAIMIFGILGFLSFLYYMFHYDVDDIVANDFEIKQKRRPYGELSLKSFFLIILLSFLVILIPDKQTIYQIIIASNITTENIKIVGEAGSDVVDYMVDKIDMLINETGES